MGSDVTKKKKRERSAPQSGTCSLPHPIIEKEMKPQITAGAASMITSG